jgi:hypothetical protein
LNKAIFDPDIMRPSWPYWALFETKRIVLGYLDLVPNK